MLGCKSRSIFKIEKYIEKRMKMLEIKGKYIIFDKIENNTNKKTKEKKIE